MSNALIFVGRVQLYLLTLIFGGMFMTAVWNMLIVRFHFPPIPMFVGCILFALLDNVIQNEDGGSFSWNQPELRRVGVVCVLFLTTLLIKLLLY